MNTIKENVIYKFEIKKSIFISCLYKINSVSDVEDILRNIKDRYKYATHYCYAYIVNDNKKSSDDGEPGGTAGAPIMEILNKNDLNNILCVVIRYFGGIKLGAGGLVRNYAKSARDALKIANIVQLIDGYRVLLELSYEDIKKVDYLLKDYIISNKTYNDNVIYELLIDKDSINILNGYNYKIIEEIKIERG